MNTIIGDIISFGGGSPAVAAFAAGKSNGTEYAIGHPQTMSIVANDEKYFTREQDTSGYTGKFICQKAGTYKVLLYARGCYNSKGTKVNAVSKLYKQNSVLATYNTNVAGEVDTVENITLNKGDNIYMTLKIASGSTAVDLSYAIIPQS
jgi:hypothetical protein